MLIQLGLYGYDEGDIAPNIILENNEDDMDDAKFDKIVKEIKIKHNEKSLGEEQIAEILCSEYGFSKKETKIVDVIEFWR